MSALVIGYGNPMRGDDRIGWDLAYAAGRRLRPIKALAYHALGPELAEMLADAELVVFVDARDGADKGRVRCESVAPLSDRSAPLHGLTPSGLLYLAQQLYGRAPRAHLVTIESDSFELGAPVSPEVLAGGVEALTLIEQLIAR